MFQCHGCDRLFSIQTAVKTHISNLTKIVKGILILFRSKSEAERPGARPGRDSESALAAWHVKGEDRYFHRGLHNLSGQGPGYMNVKLGLAAADSDGPGAGGLAGGGPAGAV